MTVGKSWGEGGSDMATPEATGMPSFATPSARWFLRAVGAVVLAWAMWQAVVVLAVLPRHLGAPTVWLEVGAGLPFWVPCWVGGVALLRGRAGGFRPLYFPAALLLAVGLVPLVPPLLRLLGPPRYGRSLGGWPVCMAALPLLVLAQRLGTQTATPAPAADGRARRRWAVLLVVLAALFVGCSWGSRAAEREANDAVRRGIAAYEEGHDDEALAEWGRVIDRYPFTSAWGVAVFDSGLRHRRRGQPRQAIALFERLLDGPVDDRDPTGYLMEAYQNYRHRACLEISACHEALNDYPEALRFALLARDKHPYESWCGTCLLEAHEGLRERIRRLEQGKDRAR
jgi:hypothetical protein